ncbi:hypothetical protein FH972_010781 [Carpinus fangiana]|uniref:Uncharacterized protein n=1 Tax=Carpinus fangiana TaxID=176857 RepID=A0A660KP99_9ROSI|nr:hypothetical protein FH972_010781 [Carpinus fangiana]
MEAIQSWFSEHKLTNDQHWNWGITSLFMYKISSETKPGANSNSCKDARTRVDIGGAPWNSCLPLLREAYSGARRESFFKVIREGS